ncbi:MAG: transposase [Opitutaceae bacterium]
MPKLAQALSCFLPQFKRRNALSNQQSKVLGSILACRTSALGIGLHRVCDCGHELIAYNSCRDRHCPLCEGRATRRWQATQCANLLPVPYHHCVFTIPDALGTLVRYNEELLYDQLFKVSAGCLASFFQNDRRFRGQGAFMGILHTWGQRLQFHPHVHYLVACAALRRDHTLAVSDGYLFDVKALSRVFRGRYLDAIEQLLQQSRLTFPPGWSRRSVCASLQQASRRNWCVYTKRPVCDPAKLVEYIGRYARKVAVSESRIDSFDSSSITYRWKDYRDGLTKRAVVSASSFVRLFVQHILPFGFKRIRYFGFWRPGGLKRAREAMAVRGEKMRRCVETLLAAAEQLILSVGEPIWHCPRCGQLLQRLDLAPLPAPNTS